MHRLAPALVALLATACSQSGAISGNVRVGAGNPGLAVMALLLQDVAVDPNDPSAGTQLTALGQIPVGISEAGEADFPYTFTALEDGTYYVGAYLDVGDDRQFTTDPISLDTDTPLVIVATDPAKQQPTHDVCVNKSCPGRGTIKGTLHLGGTAASEGALLFVLDGPLFGGGGTLAVQQVPPAADQPFTFYNLPVGVDVHVLAVSPSGCDNFGLDDEMAFSLANPIRMTPGGTGIQDGIEVWLGRQAPGFSSLAGKVTVPAPIAEGEVALFAYTLADDNTNEIERDVAFAYVPMRSKLEAPFSLPSLPYGKIYLQASIYSRDRGATCDDDDRLSTTRLLKPAPLTLQSGTPGPTNFQVNLGVGRISGTIHLGKPAATLESVWVIATQPDPAGGGVNVVQADEFLATRNGDAVDLAYSMFGLEDGTYDVSLVLDTGAYGFRDDLDAAIAGSPSKVKFEGGGRVSVNFSKD